MKKHQQPLTRDEIDACLRVLRSVSDQQGSNEEHVVEILDEVRRTARSLKTFQKKQRRLRDQDIAGTSEIRRGRKSTSVKPDKPEKHMAAHHQVRFGKTRICYICKAQFDKRHRFYDQLCAACGDLNFSKRQQTADLRGKTCVITGGRVKIGFQVALMLLRNGAQVVVTTRFPVDAARRFSYQEDFPSWHDRLKIFGLDLRSIDSVVSFASRVRQGHDSIHVLINNAAQTIRRPADFYRHLESDEIEPESVLTPPALECIWQRRQTKLMLEASRTSSSLPEFIREADAFPLGEYDRHGQQLDKRNSNTWQSSIGETPFLELVEVHLVNSFAPFLLIQELLPLLQGEGSDWRHIVNVSAVEGQFGGASSKRPAHTHTNMAKASMNMITRTTADALLRRNILINSVDTGWITNEFPYHIEKRMKDDGFEPPLDEIDGAARICDPVFECFNGNGHTHGMFLKDYHPVAW